MTRQVRFWSAWMDQPPRTSRQANPPPIHHRPSGALAAGAARVSSIVLIVRRSPTQAESFIGTVSFMSPDRVQGTLSADHQPPPGSPGKPRGCSRRPAPPAPDVSTAPPLREQARNTHSRPISGPSASRSWSCSGALSLARLEIRLMCGGPLTSRHSNLLTMVVMFSGGHPYPLTRGMWGLMKAILEQVGRPRGRRSTTRCRRPKPYGFGAFTHSFHWCCTAYTRRPDAQPEPVLDPAVFPPHACEFVAACLNAPREDATFADQMLQHPFIAAAKVPGSESFLAPHSALCIPIFSPLFNSRHPLFISQFSRSWPIQARGVVSDDTPARFSTPCMHMRMRGETEAGLVDSIVEASLSWQVRLGPAWKCVVCAEGLSHPGTPPHRQLEHWADCR